MAQLVTQGLRTRAIAQRENLADGTVSSMRSEPVIRRRVDYLMRRVEEEVHARVVAARLGAAGILADGAESAATTLVEVAQGRVDAGAEPSPVSPQTRVQAAGAVLDRLGLSAGGARGGGVAVNVVNSPGAVVQVAVLDDLSLLREAFAFLATGEPRTG